MDEDRSYELASSEVVAGFTAHEAQVLQNLIGWALDQAHDARQTGDEEWLWETFGTNANVLDRIGAVISVGMQLYNEAAEPPFGPGTRRGHGGPFEVGSPERAAVDLSENIGDALPYVQSRGDAIEVLRVFDEHARALRKAFAESIAALLEQWAEGVEENLRDDEPEGGRESFPVVEDYLADATRIRMGEQPLHEHTVEALRDSMGPAAYADDPAAYIVLVDWLLGPKGGE